MKIDSNTPTAVLVRERRRAERNHRDPFQRQRLAKIDRLLAAQGYLVG